jgi:hypothetical protein
MSVERGWVSVYGVVISAYCYIFLSLMSCLFLLGGALLTGIAFRPQEVCVSSDPLQGSIYWPKNFDLCNCLASAELRIGRIKGPDTIFVKYTSNSFLRLIEYTLMHRHTVKKVVDFPVPSQDVSNR